MNEERDESSRLSINTTWPPKGRSRWTAIGLASVTAAAGAVMVLSAGGASAAPQAPALAPSGQHQVLCHRTNSNTNPYVEINPSISSIIKKHGHDGHNGPVWDPTLKPQHIKWGDIIPPFDYPDGNHYDGKNWDATGIAIWENGCNIPGAPSSSPVESTPVESTPVESTPVESTPVESTPVSSSISATTSHTTTAVPPVPTSNGPIPGGVEAGLHTPLANAGLKAWGIVLMLLGGAAGLVAGLWPTRRRAH
jgi:cell division septation protein DedD